MICRSTGTPPITFDAQGNANYTSVDPTVAVYPANIVAYIPITLTNTQSTAVAANTPVAIGTTSGGAIIGFNALAYQQYESCNLNNGEFFLASGALVYSWMEGNMINEQTANTACTSASSANALINSANVLYWIDVPDSNFLAATTGTNTVYLGWTGNVVTGVNTLLSTTFTGEAPQLSCNNPANTMVGCGSGQYAQYDNGKKVFSTYDDFPGTTIPTGWSCFSCTYLVANAIGDDNGDIYNSITVNSVGQVLDGLNNQVYMMYFSVTEPPDTGKGYDYQNPGGGGGLQILLNPSWVTLNNIATFTSSGWVVSSLFLSTSAPQISVQWNYKTVAIATNALYTPSQVGSYGIRGTGTSYNMQQVDEAENVPSQRSPAGHQLWERRHHLHAGLQYPRDLQSYDERGADPDANGLHLQRHRPLHLQLPGLQLRDNHLRKPGGEPAHRLYQPVVKLLHLPAAGSLGHRDLQR